MNGPGESGWARACGRWPDRPGGGWWNGGIRIESTRAQLTGAVLARCRDLGFALAGVADAGPTRFGAELKAWLGAGRHGSMSYLAEQLEDRLDPQRLLPGARSVIMVADIYAQRGRPEPDPPPGSGRIARYARGRNYHPVIKKRLHRLCDALRAQHKGAEFRSFVDTAPFLEREYAARAGMGWIGKHTLVIHPRLGSYVLLGGALTTLDLAPLPEADAVADHCGTCTRCIDACPTRAITAYSVDASRCISYLTIERRGAIEPALQAAMGDRLFGCDICQEVCPHNSGRGDEGGGGDVRPEYAPRRGSFDLLEVLGWGEDQRRAAFETSALKRATLAMAKRNALIVAGNAVARAEGLVLRALVERIAAIAADPEEPAMVRETAAQVCAGAAG